MKQISSLTGSIMVDFSHLATAGTKKVVLIGKSSATGIAEDLIDLARFLESNGHSVLVERETASKLGICSWTQVACAEMHGQVEVAIVLGGDGTMLSMARQLAPLHIPLVGINQGRLGFMTDIPIDQMYVALVDILSGQYQLEQRTLLEGTVLRNHEKIVSGVAVNDIVVARNTGASMVDLTVSVDGYCMYSQRSDGLIIATPTGSTAYALSSGGPLLHPTLAGIVCVPIAPHTLSNRPIVIADHSCIEIEIASLHEANINFDMQSYAHLMVGDKIHIRRSQHLVYFLHPKGWNYYHTLREKLHWNE